MVASQPQSLAVNVGAPAQFSVVAAGPRPLAYQWRKNGTNLAAATATFYAIVAASTNDTAQYSVVVTNAYGSTTSAIATLTVLPPRQATSVTNGLVVYLNFDNNIKAQAGTTNNGSCTPAARPMARATRPASSVPPPAFANTATSGQPDDWAITLGSLEWVYSNSFSVSLWEQTSNSGDGALMGNKDWTSGANVGWVISEPGSQERQLLCRRRHAAGCGTQSAILGWQLASGDSDFRPHGEPCNQLHRWRPGQHRRYQPLGRRFLKRRVQHVDRQ